MLKEYNETVIYTSVDVFIISTHSLHVTWRLYFGEWD
jgi:hypothetical protein